jgi:hypothetical protein
VFLLGVRSFSNTSSAAAGEFWTDRTTSVPWCSEHEFQFQRWTFGFACYRLHAGFLLGLFFDPEDGGDVSPKQQLTYNALHDVISQKTEVLISPL